MRRGLIDYLTQSTGRFISVSGAPDLDLSDREQILNWVFTKVGKTPSKEISEAIKNYDDDYFFVLYQSLLGYG